MMRKLLFAILLLLITNNYCFSQSSISTNGTIIKNSSGSVSFTTGQLFYQNFKNQFSVYQGVQQPNVKLETLNSEQLIRNNIEVYPNPTQGILNIFSNQQEMYDYEIYDSNGKLVQKSKLSNHQINMIQFPSGLYIIVLFNKNSVNTIKILKK